MDPIQLALKYATELWHAERRGDDLGARRVVRGVERHECGDAVLAMLNYVDWLLREARAKTQISTPCTADAPTNTAQSCSRAQDDTPALDGPAQRGSDVAATRDDEQ